jgi:hypothetical protein
MYSWNGVRGLSRVWFELASSQGGSCLKLDVREGAGAASGRNIRITGMVVSVGSKLRSQSHDNTRRTRSHAARSASTRVDVPHVEEAETCPKPGCHRRCQARLPGPGDLPKAPEERLSIFVGIPSPSIGRTPAVCRNVSLFFCCCLGDSTRTISSSAAAVAHQSTFFRVLAISAGSATLLRVGRGAVWM